MVKTSCPKCGRSLTVKDELIGRLGRCPACQHPFLVQPASDDATAIDLLIEALANDESSVRKRAVHVLGEMKIARAEVMVVEILSEFRQF